MASVTSSHVLIRGLKSSSWELYNVHYGWRWQAHNRNGTFFSIAATNIFPRCIIPNGVDTLNQIMIRYHIISNILLLRQLCDFKSSFLFLHDYNVIIAETIPPLQAHGVSPFAFPTCCFLLRPNAIYCQVSRSNLLFIIERKYILFFHPFVSQILMIIIFPLISL